MRPGKRTEGRSLCDKKINAGDSGVGMINQTKISLHRLILSLSDALDYVCPEIADHQQRVTYIAVHMAKQMGFKNVDLADLFLAAALHDIGMIRVENRLRFIRDGEMDSVIWHGEMGYELLRSNDFFARAAEIIRHHHVKWKDGRGAEAGGQPVPVASHIICLADSVERLIDRNINILDQSLDIVEQIREKSGDPFHPECVEAFSTIAETEAFWLGCSSRRIYSLLLQVVAEIPFEATNEVIQGISEIFARVVDSMSSWTATHSAGVAATAVSLTEMLKLSNREQFYMRTAGLLHDLGKLSVPTKLLDKPGPLSTSEWNLIRCHTYHTFRILETVGFPQQITEWASLHHERIDGNGYPFHFKEPDLSLGSRIMAVADAFTAMTENRPYREGFSCDEAIVFINRMVKNGGLDGDVVSVLAGNYKEIDQIRRREQALYAEHQKVLTTIATGHQTVCT